MAMVMFVDLSFHVQRTINSTGGKAFGIVERKIPAIAARTGSDRPDSPGVLDMNERVIVTLFEFTCLLRQLNKRRPRR